MTDDKNKRKLYDALSQDYDMGSYEQFSTDVEDEGKRRKLYDAIKGEYDLPDFDGFTQQLIGQPTAEEEQPASAPSPASRASQTEKTEPVYQMAQAPGESYNYGGELPSVRPPKASTAGSRQTGLKGRQEVQKQSQNTNTEPQQEEADAAPLGPERFAKQMQMDAALRQRENDFHQRMENIRKGNEPFGSRKGVQYNPATGKVEDVYYTKAGEAVSTPIEQRQRNEEVDDWWLNHTESGRKVRDQRRQQDFETRVGSLIGEIDPENTAEAVWNEAGKRTTERQAKTARSAAYIFSNPIDQSVLMKADQLTEHDLKRMADESWNALGAEKQQQMVNEVYRALLHRYAGYEVDDNELYPLARQIAREQSDRRMYELAVEKNAPQSATENFFRKVVGQNMLTKLIEAGARAQTGTSGDMEARDQAMMLYEQDGHKLSSILGTVGGMAVDPLMWIGGATAKGVVGGGTWLAGKMAGEVAVRKGATTLGGRLLAGAAGGGANFATFEAGGEALEQMRYGGKRNEETGEVEGYDMGAVLGRAGHGALMGTATGVLGPMLGNVSDKMVRATGSTAGKMGLRAGELAVGTVAEGTIFSIPEWISGERDAMDVWTDNLAMMAGFKTHGLLKSAPRRIAELSKDPRSKAGFETRLRSVLDGRGDLALTSDEKRELQDGGYGDLSTLVEEYSNYETDRRRYGETERNADRVEPGRQLGARVDAELPYNRFVALMNDGNVSEAARAKMYYYLTGHQLPMSTVMGSIITEQTDDAGNVTGYTVKSVGVNGTITSRSFDSKTRADVEVANINRQAELNSIDVGERYTNWKGEHQRMYEACESVSEETGAPVSHLMDLMQGDPANMNSVELEWAERIQSRYDAIGNKYAADGLRAEIGSKYGVDVDKAIAKEPGRRSEAEQKAVEEYTKRLFDGVPQEEAGETSQQKGYEADPAERKDIMLRLAMEETADSEVQEAVEGMRQRIEDDADLMVAEEREEMKKRQHGDGTVHPATLKELDGEGNEKQVFIVDGNVVMDSEGNVDLEGSDRSVVVYDPEIGKRRIIDPTGGLGVSALGEVVTQEMFEADLERRKQAYIQQQMDDAQGKVSVAVGETVTVPGTDAQGTVVAVSEDGEGLTVQLEDGTQVPVVRGDLQEVADRQAIEEYEATRAEQADNAQPEPTATMVEGAPESYEPGMTITIRDYDGQEKQGVVNGRGSMMANDGRLEYVPDGTGNIVEYEVDGEVRRDRIDQMGEKVVGYSEAVETAPVNQEEPQPVEEVAETEQAAEPEATEAEPMPMREDGEADFMATTPQRGHQYIYGESGLDREEAGQFVKANIEAAEKELGKLKGKAPKMGTSLTKYQQEKADHQQQVEQAQAVLDYWNGVRAEQQRVVAAERAEQAERDRAAHDAAVLAEQERQAEELAKQQEQAERGANAVHPAIREKWDAAAKVEGAENEITLANGETLKGRYMLVESGAATPSHNATSGFARSEGFPVDENGQTVNDRDYERDQNAQLVTRQMADQYDSRAIQNVPVVSRDGVVLSGNGRTMAGELAAQQNSDGAYIEHLRKYPQQFGFTPEQVEGMQHPRVVFVPDVDMPYTTETFAKFNQQDMKSQSRTEQSVKMGKTVDDATFGRIVRSINAFDTLGDFYNDPKAAPTAIGELHNAGVINQMQVAEMMDGEKVSGQGRQMLENMLIGKAFEGNPDAVRQLAEFPAMRQSVVSALAEIANNIHLGEDYSLESELAQAINLAYQARKSGGIGAGEKVSGFARQQSLFPFDEGETVADYTNATVLMLADCLNDGRVSQMKKVLAIYNDHAAQSAAGQYDIFSGGVKSKEEIINDVLNILNNGTETEQQTALTGAAERRKEAAGVGQDGVAGNSDAGSGAELANSRGFVEQEAGLSEDEADDLILASAARAKIMPQLPVPLTSVAWQMEFGNGVLQTPMGEVKLGENQFAKMITKGRENEAGMIKPTLTDPDFIIEEASQASDGNTERSSSYLFVKAFIGNDGKKRYFFKSVTVKKDGLEINISNHIDSAKRLREALKKGKLLYRFDGGAQTEQIPASASVTTSPIDLQGVSERKDTNNSETEQEKVVSAIKSAEAEVDTNPTEGQKKAGNYKMGHVKVDGYDITIENPKGSVRRGTDPSGKSWEQEMHNTYGYIKGTVGFDKDHLDIFLSDDPTQGNVYVVDQVKEDGTFDEHKIMYGFPDTESARQAYLSNYEEGWQGLGAITPVSKEEFKKWIESSKRKMKPFSEYRSVETLGDVQVENGVSGTYGPTVTVSAEAPYSITPTQYTTKKGKVLDVQLVKFADELTSEQKKAASELNKELRGWWSREDGGYLMRSEDDARRLVEALTSEEGVADAQPLSLSDMAEATDVAQLERDETQGEMGGYPGQLISYSDEEGNIHDGILMPDSWEPSMLRTSGVPIEGVMGKIRNYENVESQDGKVSIYGSDYAQKYFLEVPKTKKEGAQYYENAEILRSVTDGIFYPFRGGKLRADIPARNIDAVVKELGRMGVRVKSDEETEKRRRMVDDSELIERLESEPKETGYRNVVLNADGTLGSPMASKLGRKGVGRSATSGFAFGSWEQADENPDMATDEGKIDLIKPDGKSVAGVDYNPYIHIRPTLVNKQFKQAWERPNLVYVETEYPSSELTSGYRAEKAKKAVGRHDWNGGELILSRWDKPVRIVPWERVADDWEQEFKGKGIPFDIIPPRLLPILAERGMEILPPHKGMGKACNDAYERWKSAPEAYYGENVTVQREGETGPTELTYGDWFDQGSVERIGAFAGYSRRRIDAMKERQKASVRKRLEEQIEKMGLKDRVVMVESADELGDVSEEDRRSKGWYDVETGKIVIVLDNHTSSDDVIATILHEGVAHYGLRQLFGKHFDTFLDNVYASATEEVRGAITNLAANKYGWNIREATEEYIAGLAEDTDFESPERQSWWAQIKRFFWDMLHKLGIAGQHIKDAISDNELRYLLWRSYQNLVNPGRYRSLVEEAEDIAMQWNLQVGRYEERYGELRSERAGRWYAPARAAESGMRLHRDGDGTPQALARDSYERMLNSGMNQFKEAVQDSMLSLKKLYESVLEAEGAGNVKIEEVKGYENAYLAENRMHSSSEAEIHAWQKDYMEPIVKAVHALAGSSDDAYEELIDYMMAKHGLERNEVFARRDADRAASQGKDWDEEYSKNRERDYAGLTSLTGEKDVAAAEREARKMVDYYENGHDSDAVDELWKAVNNATRSSLRKTTDSGLMSADRHQQVRDMFEYYIPLQGFDSKVAEDVYAYMGSDGTMGYGTPIRAAKGRVSKADDPLATIAMNGEAAIRRGNRNLMKQHFLRFVEAHPSDLVSVSDVWLRHNDVTDEWEQYFDADLQEGDSAEVVAQKVEAFEQKMEQLSSSDPDHYKRGRDLPNVPYRVLRTNDMSQHQVVVMRNGKTVVLTINGSPRAAQALNGLTNPDVFTDGVFGKAMNFGQMFNRQLSLFYTTRNPEFVLSNFLRDAIYSNTMSWVKESPNYAIKFHKNFGRTNPVTMGRLFAQWENGSLRERVTGGSGSALDKQFYEFMMNGGETGWTNMRDIEKHKKDLEKAITREGSTSRKVWKALGRCFDLMNRSVENCARFAAFVTSRQMGRSIERSIWDAKEVSVNFNKKGAGDKFLTAKGQRFLGVVGATTGGLGRGLYVFFNASLQGLNNIARATKRHPWKAAGGLFGTLFTLGAVIPLLSSLIGGDDDDDDKNNYYNLPEYIRRSNICFRWRSDMPWVTIPLPIEYRAIYGLGELATGMLTGNERYSDEEAGKQIVSQLSQVLPLDFMEGGGGWHAFVPSQMKPFVEANSNKSWTGLPIYRDNKYRPYDPQWTRAYQSANKQIVEATRWLNEATGGDDVTQGWIDWNPAKIEYMLKGYLGGYFTMYDRLQKTAETVFGDREFEWRNIPMASRVLKEGDERTEARKITNDYFNMLDEYKKTDAKLKGYEKIAESDREDAIEYAQRIDWLHNSREYTHYLIMDAYQPVLKAYYDKGKEAEGDEKQQLKTAENALRKQCVDLIHAVDEGRMESVDAIDAYIEENLLRILDAGTGSGEENATTISKAAQSGLKKHNKLVQERGIKE